MSHLLVTNDFPPKVGGIQSYLWELWRRLTRRRFTVLTTPYAGADAWDAEQPFRVVRTAEKVLLPTPSLARRIDALAAEVGAEPGGARPGAAGRAARAPPGAALRAGAARRRGHRARPAARAPGAARPVLRGASEVIAAGGYPAAEGERAAGRPLPVTVVPPGVDTDRFGPLDAEQRPRPGPLFDLPADGRVVVSLSRLVPRKGMDVLIEAAARLAPSAPTCGGHRRRGPGPARLERLVARTGAPVRLLGRVPDDDLPALYGCADVYAMLCRNRWAGLEQEGFGIVFLEAAACGVPQVAGQRRRGRGGGRRRDRAGGRRPGDPGRGGAGAGRAARRPGAAPPAMGRRPGGGPSRSSPTTCWPSAWRGAGRW